MYMATPEPARPGGPVPRLGGAPPPAPGPAGFQKRPGTAGSVMSVASNVSTRSHMSDRKRAQLQQYLDKEELKDALLAKMQMDHKGCQNDPAAIQAVEEQVDQMLRDGTADDTLTALKKATGRGKIPANRSGIAFIDLLNDRPKTPGVAEVKKAVSGVYHHLNEQGVPVPDDDTMNSSRGILRAEHSAPNMATHYTKGTPSNKKGSRSQVAKYPPGAPQDNSWAVHSTSKAASRATTPAAKPAYPKYGYDSEFMKTPALTNNKSTMAEKKPPQGQRPGTAAAGAGKPPQAPRGPADAPAAMAHRELAGERGMSKNAKRGPHYYSSDDSDSYRERISARTKGQWGFKTPPATPPAGLPTTAYNDDPYDQASSRRSGKGSLTDDEHLLTSRSVELVEPGYGAVSRGRTPAGVPPLSSNSMEMLKSAQQKQQGYDGGAGGGARPGRQTSFRLEERAPPAPRTGPTPSKSRAGGGPTEFAPGYTPRDDPDPGHDHDGKVLMPVFTVGPRKVSLEELMREKIRERSNAGPLFVYKSFRNIDTDQTGKISPENFQRWLGNYNIDLALDHVRQIMRLYDRDGDGQLDYGEFIRRVMPQDFEPLTAEERELARRHNEEYFSSIKTPRSGGFKPGGMQPDPGMPPKGAALSPRAGDSMQGPSGWEDILRQKIREKSAAGPFYLLKVFKHFDKDNSGTMSHNEFRKVLAKFNVVPSREEFDAICAKYDADGSGEIDFYEFVDRLLPSDEKAKKEEASKMVANLKGRLEKRFASMRDAFRAYDKDKNGTLDMQEIMNIIHGENLAIDQSAVLRLAERLDADHSGEVSYDEFAKALSAEAETMMQEQMQSMKPAEFADRFEGNRHIPVEARAPAFQVPMSGERLEALLREKMQQRIRSGPGELRAAFKHFDVDGSGTITITEFRKALRNFNISPHERDLAELMHKYDMDGRGEIDYYEFIYRLMPPDYPTVGQQMRTRAMDDLNVAFGELRERLKAIDVDRNNGFQTGLLPDHVVVSAFWDGGAGMSRAELERMVRNLRKYAGGKVSYGDLLGQVHARVKQAKMQQLVTDVARAPKGLLEALTDSAYPKAFDVRAPPFQTKMTVDQLQELVREKLAARTKGGGGELRYAYKHFDKGGTGRITYESFERALRDFNIRLDPKNLAKLLRRFDPGQTGHIDYHEFMNRVLPPYHITMQEEGYLKPLRNAIPTDFAEVRRAFRALDRDQSGRLDIAELRAVCRVIDVTIPEEHLAGMCDAAGGSLSVQDFTQMLRSKEVMELGKPGTNDPTQKGDYSPTAKVPNYHYEAWELPPTPDRYNPPEPTPRPEPQAIGLDRKRPMTPDRQARQDMEREKRPAMRMVDGEPNALYQGGDHRSDTDLSGPSTYRSSGPSTNRSWGHRHGHAHGHGHEHGRGGHGIMTGTAPAGARGGARRGVDRPTTASMKKRRGPAHRPASAGRLGDSWASHGPPVPLAKDSYGYGGYAEGQVDDYGRGGAFQSPGFRVAPKPRPTSAWR